jgi:hypothetical protein
VKDIVNKNLNDTKIKQEDKLKELNERIITQEIIIENFEKNYQKLKHSTEKKNMEI